MGDYLDYFWASPAGGDEAASLPPLPATLHRDQGCAGPGLDERQLTNAELVMYVAVMAIGERSLSYMLRNSGAVLDEVEQRDIVIQRRDGEDLYLALSSRERGIRESLGVLAGFVRAALHDESRRSDVVKWLADDLPWTSFLPEDDRERFLIDFAQISAACADADTYEPLVRALDGWKATAEAYANPEVLKLLTPAHRGSSVPLPRPPQARAGKR